MLQALYRRLRRDEEGFTLIELMVVVLIIAILLAIAIPTFLGARERAQERAAQSNVRNAYTAAKTIYTDNQTWTGLNMTDVQNAEPSLIIAENTSTDAKIVDVLVSSAAGADWGVLTVKSANGKCFSIMEHISGLTPTTDPVGLNPKGTLYKTETAPAAGCDASTGGTWKAKF
jgi:type IV pilus assembly protein PilA